jgi:hypothetical protein
VTSTTEAELTVDDLRKARRAIEHCFESGWTDGMPVVPPLPEFIDEFLTQTKRDPDDVICTADHLNRVCTVRDAAASAVMAGCKPEYFRTFLAIVDAFQDIGPVMSQSTTGRAFAILINGPIRQELGINCTGNIFGPGDRPNSTLGRALRLLLMNIFDIRPHELDQSTHGTPGKYSICIGENEEESPWEPLHVQYGFAPDVSTVMIQQCRSTIHIDHRTTQDSDKIIRTIADSMSYPGHATGNSSSHGKIEQTDGVYHKHLGMVVVMGPLHAQHLAAAGLSKADVLQRLFDTWGATVDTIHRYVEPAGLEGVPEDAFIRAAASPDGIKLVVAGASNAAESTLLPGYSKHAGPVVIETN